MNRRKFLINLHSLTLAGCALGYTQYSNAQDVRPVFQPPTLTVARGAEVPVADRPRVRLCQRTCHRCSRTGSGQHHPPGGNAT